jgi:hypothetical protein
MNSQIIIRAFSNELQVEVSGSKKVIFFVNAVTGKVTES